MLSFLAEMVSRPRANKMTFSVNLGGGPSCEKMTFYVKVFGARPLNIEIEGTGGLAADLPRNLVGVIFFANTGTPKRGVGLYRRPRG